MAHTIAPFQKEKLDALDHLRRLNLNKDDVPLPTIVIIGDKSVGVSRVIESIAGISLSNETGFGIRVPLVIRLQNSPNCIPDVQLEYNNIVEKTTEVVQAIEDATVKIAGVGEQVLNLPLYLVVKKNDVPDLTIVLLPEIIPVSDQTNHIRQQIMAVILDHIKPKQNLIVNVVSADAHLATSHSVHTSRSVDPTGERTLFVITKTDKHPDDHLEEVLAKEKMDLGYVFVTDGVDKLTQRLVKIQSGVISESIPVVVKNISDELYASTVKLSKLPFEVPKGPATTVACLKVIASILQSLENLFIKDIVDGYDDDNEMHPSERLFEIFDDFFKELHKRVNFFENFLVEEMKVLPNKLLLPHSFSDSALLYVLESKLNSVSTLPARLVDNVWEYILNVCARVYLDFAKHYGMLNSLLIRATTTVLAKFRSKCHERFHEMIQAEKMTAYTCDPCSVNSWKKLVNDNRETFLRAVQNKKTCFMMDNYGDVTVEHLWGIERKRIDEAFELSMRTLAYWTIVVKRINDCVAVHLRYMITNVIKNELKLEIEKEVKQSPNMESLMTEGGDLVKNREALHTRIRLLEQAEKIMDEVVGLELSFMNI